MLRGAGFVVVLVVVGIAVVPAGSPVQVSYVYSDSMEPTIGVDDGYVLVPAGDVTTGDVVTFWSPTKDTHVTHRVVDRTDGGFVTRGDNNPATDQAAGYEPVSRDQVVGKVLAVGGDPVVVPQLGAAIQLIRTHLLGILAGCLGAFALYSATRSGGRQRSVTRLRDVFQPLFLVGVVAITGLLAFGQPSHDVTYVAVSAASSTDAPGVVAVGSSKPVEFVLQQPNRPLLTRVVETHGLTDVTQTQNATAVNVDGTVPAPESSGPVRVRVNANQYPGVLPHWLLARFQAVHPLLASAASAVAVLAPLWVGYHATVDPRTPLRTRPSRWLTALQRGWR